MQQPDRHVRNHPKRRHSTGGQATSLWQEKTVSILQLQGQSKISKGPFMQNCLVSIPARFRQMDKMAFTDLYHAKSSSHRNYPALCFKMVDRINVQRTQKSFRAPRGMAADSTSIGQMDNVPLIGLQSTKTPCVNPWSGIEGAQAFPIPWRRNKPMTAGWMATAMRQHFRGLSIRYLWDRKSQKMQVPEANTIPIFASLG